MGNRVGGRRRRPAVEDRYTRPQGLYPHPDIDLRKLRRLIVEAKLAPCHPGADDPRADLDECPICFLFYPSLNRSKCCAKGICTECFLQMKSPTSCRPTQCPYCKTLNYAVEYRGVKTKEEKGIEQLVSARTNRVSVQSLVLWFMFANWLGWGIVGQEEQRVIEAQIRMRHQELQEDAERMKNKQTAASTDAVATAQVECCDTDGTSTTTVCISSVTFGAEGNMDLEEVMLMEAIWLSLQLLMCGRVKIRLVILQHYETTSPFCDLYFFQQDQETLGNPGCVGTTPPSIPSRSNDGSMTTMAEAASSGGFACAVAALAEQQHMHGESSSTPPCQTTRFDILSKSDRSSTEDLSIAGSSSADSRVEEPSSSRTHRTIEGAEYPNDQWSEVAEVGTSHAGSDVTVEAVAANSAASVGSNIASGSIPDSFEEQMMLAMALSLVDARAKSNSPGLAWR
ncbi:hypothetical protein BAE44_0018358 [Dichanthelium oligosanthes]|uniref:RING-type domain-containing protein n=1 Tax=Dichanthelium oligosanthes TaxID=888268 RepID=A0A1E5V627_9POAL|nr:hypothetical protein BAE44_0018358 [Dichanthelium oligosanthes]